ncbi:unnamed protein product [Choristocarpus tenellus]
MLFNRSPNMVQAMDIHCPFSITSTSYAGWHIRTSDGETSKSFDPNVHRYTYMEAPETVVFSYSRSMSYAAKELHINSSLPVYLSTNSQEMKKVSMKQLWNVSFIDLQWLLKTFIQHIPETRVRQVLMPSWTFFS